MKKSTLNILIALLVLFIALGCDKTPLASIGPEIQVARTTVYPFDPEFMLFTGATATDSVNWTVEPAGLCAINPKANTAGFSFRQVGTYVITAQKKMGGPSAKVTIKVVSNTPPFQSETGTTNTTVVTTVSDTTQFTPITGNVNVGVSFWRDKNSGKVVSYVNLRTVTKYCSRGIVQYTAILDDSQNFSLDIVNIRQPKGCLGATAPDFAPGAEQVFKNKLLDNGTHQLKITLNGVTYTGTIVITATTTVVNWSYTSGVIVGT